MRYGAVLRRQGDLEGALVPLGEAEAVFIRLRAGGDSSEALALGLATALQLRAAVLGSQKLFPEAFAAGDASLALLRPLAAKPDATLNVQRSLGESLHLYGFNLLRSGQVEKSVEHFRQARQIFSKLGAPGLADLSIAALYGSSAVWMGEAFDTLGDVAQSQGQLSGGLRRRHQRPRRHARALHGHEHERDCRRLAGRARGRRRPHCPRNRTVGRTSRNFQGHAEDRPDERGCQEQPGGRVRRYGGLPV